MMQSGSTGGAGAPDEELAALLRAAGLGACEAIPLSRRGGAAQATVFRVRAAGVDRKGVLLLSAAQARTVATLAAAVPVGLPRVLARAGRALLTEWVPGEDLRTAGCDDAMRRAVGAWQALVHTLPVPVPVDADTVRRTRARLLDERLARLAAAGALPPAWCAALATAARAALPADAAAGITLGDCCADNLVWHAGAPYCVDLETLDVQPLDYDLARTWYRWPMTAAQRRAWLDGYATRRAPVTFLAHLPFWLVAALAEGAVFRLDERPHEAAEPLALLEVVHRALARGVRGAELLAVR